MLLSEENQLLASVSVEPGQPRNVDTRANCMALIIKAVPVEPVDSRRHRALRETPYPASAEIQYLEAHRSTSGLDVDGGPGVEWIRDNAGQAEME